MAALVSKRFHALSGGPSPLSVGIGALQQPAPMGAALRRLRAFQPWLIKHSARLGELELECHITREADEVRATEAASLLDSCLLAAITGSSCGLRRLCLGTSFGPRPSEELYDIGGWASLDGLQHVTIMVPGRLRLFCSLEGATQLRCLELEARSFEAGPAAVLPASLTKLVGHLSTLRSVTLAGMGAAPGGMPPLGGLSNLAGLQHLALIECDVSGWLPGAAHHISGLQALELIDPFDEDELATLSPVLRLLPQLRGLWLEWDGACLPPTAADLSRLRWLYCNSWGAGGPTYPAGACQKSLRRLVLHPEAAKANVPFLAGLERLEVLGLVQPMDKMFGQPPVHWHAFFAWAARHPPLRRLEFPPESVWSFKAGVLSPDIMNAVIQLLRARPALAVECLATEDGHGDFFREQLLAEWA
ncbi:hypothetical protein ABPG75_010258 [Micractinium tetrahymenae]